MIDVIANRYAEALFQLSEEENITKEIYNELHDVVEVIKNNKELDNVLKSPLVAKNEKTQLKLSKKYNKNVTLENEVDQSILGGVLVRLGNTQIDGSVKTRLNNIKDQLTQVIS